MHFFVTLLRFPFSMFRFLSNSPFARVGLHSLSASYEQQQRKNTDPPPPAASAAATSPQRPVSPRKSSRSAVSLTPDQIAEYKKQAQEYYSQAKSGDVRSVICLPTRFPPLCCACAHSGKASSSAAAGARKVSNADSMPVFRGATNSDAPSNLPNWSRKKSVLTPIPPAELLAAMNAQVCFLSRFHLTQTCSFSRIYCLVARANLFLIIHLGTGR